MASSSSSSFLKLKSSSIFPRLLKSLLQSRRFCHTLINKGLEEEFLSELGPVTVPPMDVIGNVDPSTWRKVDARALGIRWSMLPESSRIVIRLLQSEGHDAFLVGGCVRDLLLNKVPKDFDVITTANLKEIKHKFHRAMIVGRRFPICIVHVKGSEVEVSSFQTVAKGAKNKEVQLPQMPKGYDEKDVLLWQNSLNRDFTINSLFYDPFAQKVYDYSSGMADLSSLKLRTIAPAFLSFQGDCARILRGLRLAARLGLSFSKETEKAICNQYDSIAALDKGRLMLEMNYMLSYGAAERSLLLLKKFKLLGILLPFHDAYLDNYSDQQAPGMLMKLFSNLDDVVSCDQPCDSVLWVSLLAFHLALVKCPQDALVVWTIASVLYHGKWEEGVKSAPGYAVENVNFASELSEPSDDVTEEQLLQKVAHFGSNIKKSLDALIDPRRLRKVMDHDTSAPRSDFVFISKNAGGQAAQIFDVLDSAQSLTTGRDRYNINYQLLGKGDIRETRFVLGKIIMDTLRGGTVKSPLKLVTEKRDVIRSSSEMKAEQVDTCELDVAKSKGRVKRKSSMPEDEQHQQRSKKQKLSCEKPHADQLNRPKVAELMLVKNKLGEIFSSKDISKKNHQLKKVVVKDVKKLLSLQKKPASKNDAKLDGGKHREEARSPKEILNVLDKAPKTVKEQEVEACNKDVPSVPEISSKVSKKCKAKAPGDVLSVLEKAPKSTTEHEVKGSGGVLEKAPKVAKKSKARAPGEILSVLKKAPKSTTEHKAEGSTEMSDAVQLSSIFKGETKSSKKDSIQDKQKIVQEKPSRGTGKLSSIFR